MSQPQACAFYGESGPVIDPVVSDILRTLSRHSIPLWYIRSALHCALEFYKVGPELEKKFPRGRFMEMNEGGN